MATQTDQAGKVITYGYDANSRLTSVTDALNQVTTYSYDEQGNKLSQTDAEGRVTSWTHDNLGRVLTRKLPLGQTESISYDNGGNLATRTDFNGNTTTHAYDNLNRLSTRTFDDGTQFSWTYNNLGQVETETNYLGETSFIYDNRNRLSRQDNPDGSFLAYAYDLNGNRLSVETGSGLTSYSFDELNRMATVTDTAGGVTAYGYDKVGNQVSVTHGNGTLTTSVYDDLNRLASKKTKDQSGAVLTQFDYSLDAAGNRTQLAELGRTVVYTYDDVYRLTSEEIVDSVNGNNLFEYSYDKVGNRLTKTTNSGAPVTYVYDENDRLSSAEGNTYFYDNNGNLLSKDGPSAFLFYGYDLDDRVRSSENLFAGPDGFAEYEYDVGGIRRSKTVGGVKTNFTVDENRSYAQVLEEMDGSGALLLAYTYGTDLLSKDDGGVSSYYHYDGLGSTRVLSDSAGALTDSYDFEAFGKILNQSGVTDNSYLYAGEQFDVESGNYYLRARYYDPSGRFTQMDRWQGRALDPITLNKYVYGNSNPVMGVDPSGNMTLVGQTASISLSLGPLVQVGLAGLKAATFVCSAKFAAASVFSLSNSDFLSNGICEPNRMRVQWQKGSVSVDLSKILTASPGIGVSVNQVQVGLMYLWENRTTVPWWPSSGGTKAEVENFMYNSIITLSEQLKSIPPLGVSTRTSSKDFLKKRKKIKGSTYRIDIENLQGHNLRR